MVVDMPSLNSAGDGPLFPPRNGRLDAFPDGCIAQAALGLQLLLRLRRSVISRTAWYVLENLRAHRLQYRSLG